MNTVETKHNLGVELALEAIEEGKKLISIREAMDNHGMEFPFTLYNALYDKYVTLVEIHDIEEASTAECCNKSSTNGSGVSVAKSIPCVNCIRKPPGERYAGWCLDFKNWRLIK